MNKRTVAVALIGIVGTASVLAGCGSSGKNGSSSSSSENTFVLSEFTIIPPSNALHSGRVSLIANNVGGEVHELVIVRAANPSALPTKSDGSVDEDKIAAGDKVGEIEDVAAGARKTKTFELEAGTYVALCNIADSMKSSNSMVHGGDMGSGSGHIHFSEGMHVTFTVS